MHKIHSKWRKPTPKVSARRRAAGKANAEKYVAARKLQEERAAEAESATVTKPNPKPSTSRRKLQFFESTAQLEGDSTDEDSDASESDHQKQSESDGGQGEFLLVHRDFWEKFVHEFQCSFCKTKTLEVRQESRKGFAVRIVVRCKQCGEVLNQAYTSPRANTDSTRPPFLCNQRFADAMTDMGLGNFFFTSFLLVRYIYNLQYFFDFSFRLFWY